MAKKAKSKSIAAYDDNDDSEDEFEDDKEVEAATEFPKIGGQPNAAAEGDTHEPSQRADVPDPEFSTQQAEHYLKNVGHWHQFLTTIKQYANNKIAEEKNAQYKAALSAHPTK